MIAKRYVDVTAVFHSDGTVIPLCVNWSDGRRFPIDRVTDIRRAASLKAGGVGIRYTCMINGHEKFLFLEESRWFLEQHRSDQ